MARPRTFDEEQALDAAIRAFWATGYEATSTETLCHATGLRRSSIYNTFTSKHDLFRRSLARYMERFNAELSELLDDERLTTREKVRTMLQRIVDQEAHPEAQEGTGCLVVNTAVELGMRDADIAELLRRDYERRHAALTACLNRGRRAGEIAADRDAAALAHFLIAAVAGIRIAARSGTDQAALQSIADAALATV